MVARGIAAHVAGTSVGFHRRAIPAAPGRSPAADETADAEEFNANGSRWRTIKSVRGSGPRLALRKLALGKGKREKGNSRQTAETSAEVVAECRARRHA